MIITTITSEIMLTKQRILQKTVVNNFIRRETYYHECKIEDVVSIEYYQRTSASKGLISVLGWIFVIGGLLFITTGFAAAIILRLLLLVIGIFMLRFLKFDNSLACHYNIGHSKLGSGTIFVKTKEASFAEFAPHFMKLLRYINQEDQLLKKQWIYNNIILFNHSN